MASVSRGRKKSNNNLNFEEIHDDCLNNRSVTQKSQNDSINLSSKKPFTKENFKILLSRCETRKDKGKMADMTEQSGIDSEEIQSS